MWYSRSFTVSTVRTEPYRNPFELAKIPYVGCGVLASAVSMDKLSTKRMVSGLGICQAAYVSRYESGIKGYGCCYRENRKEIPYPVFVEAVNAGSSEVLQEQTTEKS